MPSRFTESELPNRSVALCDADGRLNPEGVGWTRFPVHDCRLTGRWLRKKRWNYWCITSETHLFSITISNIDYAGVVFIYLLDFETKRFVEKTITVPFGKGLQMTDGVMGSCAYAGSGVDIRFTSDEHEASLHVVWDNFGGKPFKTDVHVKYPHNYESMSVVIPWDDTHFQYTSKHHGMAAEATLEWGEERIEFDPERSYACLDFGRGIWPYSSFWNWGGGSGRSGDQLIGLNLGAGWTDGTGLTENGVIVNGVLRKIHDTLNFDYDPKDFMKPWSIKTETTDEINLVFTPFFERVAKSNLLVIKSEVHQMIGRYSGTIISPDGETISVDTIVGWAEEHSARW
jgi:hypothetical protein